MDIDFDIEDVSRELIKCVVVGDTGVGKTRLICAKACGQSPTLEQLINVHVPTVWAIDQYRICREVLERSYDVVDSIPVSLRIWDTFGDHHNDRCFAYGRSDVVLLCYSVANYRSLEHAKTVWYPEIRRQRPNVPILLVGCKNDLRYLYLQPEFQRLLTQRRPSPLRPVHGEDIVFPEEGRAAAKEIGAFYYETSVLTRFGVEETFQNAIRAALCRRRQGRLWSGHFQCVKLPQVQTPFLPPKPPAPRVEVAPSCYAEQMDNLVQEQSSADETMDYKETYYDCVLRVGEHKFMVHKLVLAASSRMFYRLFVCTASNCQRCPRDSDSEDNFQQPASQESLLFETSDKDLLLLDEDEDDDMDAFCLPVLHRPNCGTAGGGGGCSGSQLIPGKDGNARQHKRGKSVDLHHRHASSSSMVTCSGTKIRHATIGASSRSSSSRKSVSSCGRPVHAKCISVAVSQGLPSCVVSMVEDFRRRNNYVVITLTTVTLKNDLSPKAVKAALKYMYSGEGDQFECVPSTSTSSSKGQKQCSGVPPVPIDECLKVAEVFEIDSLRDLLLAKMGKEKNGTEPSSTDSKFATDRSANLIRLGLECGLFNDVKFVLEDGIVRAQKFILCGRCDVMRAMFSNAFRESCLSQVSLPGVGVEALRLFLTYLFVNSICYDGERSCHLNDFLEALELANRMCIPRLVTVIECEIVREMERLETMQDLSTEEVLLMLEPAQLCNAHQLVAWCFHYLCCNYLRAYDQCGKLMKTLSPANQEYIVKHRWPPLWYLKEHDWHERIIREGQRAAETAANKLLKRTRTSGCLCFATRGSARMQHNSI